MKKILLLLLVTLATLNTGYSQAFSTYSFGTSTTTFSSISSTGTYVSGLYGDDITICSIPIGFTFTYCSASYTTVCASSNIWASLASTSSIQWNNIAANIAGAGFLMPFWNDMHGGGSPTAGMYYQTTGTTPNRVFTLEWKNWHLYNSGSTPTSDCGNVQLKLYEGTNCVEFVYGTNSFTSSSSTWSAGATIGIANSTTLYQTLNNSSSTPTPSSSTFTTSITAWPGSGQVYRWCPCPVSITVANDGPTCPGGTIVLTGTTSGTSYSWSGPGSYSSGALVSTISSITAAQAGNYTLTATSGTCSVSATTNVSVLPAPSIVVTSSHPDTICLGTSPTYSISPVASTSTTILSQNWNSGMTGAVGGTWSITNLIGSAASYFQLRAAPGWASAVPGNGSQYMECSPDAFTGQVTHSWFTSPSFSTIGYTSATLNYNHRYQTWYADTFVNVEYSIDGGTTWNVIINYFNFYPSSSGAATWTSTSYNETLTMPAAMLCQPNVKLRWRYYGDWGYWWAVDDILLSGTPTTASYTWTGSSGSGLACTTCNPNTVTPATTGLHTYTVVSNVCSCPVPTVVAVYVNALTTAITGSPQTCIGTNTTLSNSTAGGSWSSGNTAVATVGSGSGVVTGVTSGTAYIYYCMPGGCCAQMLVTVYATPGAITGSTSVCTGLCTTLNNAVAGGSWSSSNPAIATVDPSTGVTCGLVAGSTIITYAFGGSCYTLATVNVFNPPSTVSGSLITCAGTTSSLSGTPSGGLWSIPAAGPSSGTPSTIASVGITNGVVTGIGAGTVTLSYRIGICAITRVFSVVPSPGTITSTPAGVYTVCPGNSLPLSNSVVGGSWSSTNTSVATIGSSTGVVTGNSSGTTIISYVIGSTCFAITTVTVTSPPPPISGDSTVCVGNNITLSHATPSGTWTSSNTFVATISSGGVVTGANPGTTLITYTVPSGCIATKVVTVIAAPSAISGSYVLCQGATASLSSTPLGGTWSSTTPGVGTVDATTGVWGAVSGGNTTIIYTVGGCNTSFVATVNATPIIAGGTSPVCQGYTTSLTATPSGGTWVSSDPSTATVGASTGVVSGIVGGTATITYTSLTGCSNTKVVTVNGTPTIGGSLSVCLGLCNTLTTSGTGGTWSSSNPAVASITSSGVACGLSIGGGPMRYK